MIIRMEPFDAFRYYMAMKLHFESDTYEAPKYNYKTSAKPQSFWKRKDKYFFAKLAKRFSDPNELIQFYTSQFISDSKWVGDMMNDEDNYSQWQKRNQSLTYTFEQDINRLSDKVESFDELLTVTDGQHPLVISEYLSGTICIETVVILDKLTRFMSRADRQITETIVWPDVSRKIRKYNTFLNPNLEKMKKVVLKVFTS